LAQSGHSDTLNQCPLYPKSGHKSATSLGMVDAIQGENLTAASIARNHVQVSLGVCSQVADDSDLFIARNN